jgi:hypothetical protein
LHPALHTSNVKRGVFVLFNISIFCDIYLFVNARVESVVV